MEPQRQQGTDTADRVTFIKAHTRLLSPPLVPEIRLHLAEESVPIWQKTEEELGEMNLPPPYWAFAWAGGQALARYILDTPMLCRGRAVLDIGSGSALTAIAAAKMGARSVRAADIDAYAVAAARLNAVANGVEIDVAGEDPLSRPPPESGIVLIGDLFYERALADRVVRYVDAAKAAGLSVLVGDPQRNYFPRNRFTQLAAYGVPVSRDLEDAEIKSTSVWAA